jgi:hypothetical protein
MIRLRKAGVWLFCLISLVAVPSSIGSVTSHHVVITSGPSGTTESTSATFTFTLNDGYGSPECSLDGGAYGGCSSPQSYSGLPVGTHTFAVRATLRGVVDTDSRTWTIAAPPPAPAPETEIASGPQGPTSSTGATFAFGSNAADATFQCKLDATAFAPCTSPVSYSGLEQGAHLFFVYAVGPGGADSTPASRSWIADTIAPTASMLKPSATFQLAPTFAVTWSGTDAASGIATYEVRYRSIRYDGPRWTSTPAPWRGSEAGTTAQFTGVSGNTYCFKVKATDAAGNTTAAWSSERCTAVPVPAASLKAIRGQWQTVTGGIANGSYLNTFRRPTDDDYTPAHCLGLLICGGGSYALGLSGVKPVRMALIATTCPTCGAVWVWGRGPYDIAEADIRRVDLVSPSTKKAHLLTMSVMPGAARWVVVSPSRPISVTLGRPRIEAIAISRAPIIRANAK